MLDVWVGHVIELGYLAASGGLFYRYAVRPHKACVWLGKGALVVDVDTHAEFAKHHPHMAVGVPLEDLALRAAELGRKDRPIVVFAHSWMRGFKAVNVLRGLGFEKVMNAANIRIRESWAKPEREPAVDRKLPVLSPIRDVATSRPGSSPSFPSLPRS